jgi:hypothetical protein
MEPEESDKPAESRFPWQYWLLGALILYPLSIGPLARLVCEYPEYPNLKEALLIFYAPLFFICDHFPLVNNLVNWYLSLWGLRI